MERVVVVGNGLAGMSAAVHCARQGLRVTLVSVYPPGRSQSVMAMGGIAAALDHKNDGDSTQVHFDDTLKGGVWLADPNAVRGLVNAAPGIIAGLERDGALFSRLPDGEVDQRPFGGHSKKRTCFCGTQTGKQLVSALTYQLRKYEAEGRILQMYGYRMLGAAIDDNRRCVGCVLMDALTGYIFYVTCSSLIVATGGLNGMYGNAVGNAVNDAGATAALFSQGVELANLEFVQFHPTTVQTPSKRMLISEAARGDGGRLYVPRNGQPWYFMEEAYPEKGNLMPRDVVSREIYKVCHELKLGINGGESVYLDIRHLGKELITTRLDEVYSICKNYLKLDPTQEPIPVFPGVHFFMGGIRVDVKHRSSVENLYAAGECACQYHGANRLGANSLLAAVYGGQTAATQAVAEHRALPAHAKKTCQHLEESIGAEIQALLKDDGQLNRSLRQQINGAVNASLGITRDKNGLESSIRQMSKLHNTIITEGIRALIPYEAWLTQKTALLAEASLTSALHRTESRGAHMRSDYPNTDEAQRQTSVISYEGQVQVKYEKIAEEKCCENT